MGVGVDTDSGKPFGLRKVVLTPIAADGTLGTSVPLPVGRTFSFSEAEDNETLEGDDKIVATHGKGAVVNWDLESGGISLAAWQVLSGGTLSTVSGTTPNRTWSISKKSTDQRPYFQVEGQSIEDGGGDVHGVLFKCKVTDTLEGSFEQGSFFLTSCSGTAIGDTVDDLWKFTENETATDIVLTP